MRRPTAVSVVISLIMLVFAGEAADRHAESNLILSLAQRASTLSSDIDSTGETVAENRAAQIQAGSSVHPYTTVDLICMTQLSHVADSVESKMRQLHVSVALSEIAVSAFDRQSAVEYTKLTVDETENVLPPLRKSTNDAAANCSQSVIVNQKAGQVLSLLSDTEAALDALSLKIGHSRYSKR